jgi:hypothetical protein
MKNVVLPILLSTALFSSGATLAASNANDDLSVVRTGTLVCGKGDIRVRNLNTDLRLFTIKVEIYDRLGTRVYDSSATGFPAGYKRTLPPMGSTLLNDAAVSDLITTPNDGGPWQTWISFKNIGLSDYTATHGLPPKVGGVRTHKDETGAVLGFHSFGCTYQTLNR